MTDNYIPAAQAFDCTHGRCGMFFLRLEQDSEAKLWSWHMVFAGHPRICPEHLQQVISSSEEYADGAICRVAATKQAHDLSAAHEQWYFENRSSLRSIEPSELD